MAAGETFLIKYEFNGETYYTPGICSSALLETILYDDYRKNNLNLNGLFNFVDDTLGTTVWQLAVFPVYNVDSYNWGGIRKVFPGARRLLVDPSGMDVIGPDGSKIPKIDLKLVQTSGFNFIYSYQSGSTNIALPGIRTFSLYNAGTGRSDISAPFIVFPDNGIVDGKIVYSEIETNLSYTIAYVSVTIEDESYNVIISNGGYGTVSPITNSYWDGQSITAPPSNDPFAPGGETPQTPGGTGGTGDFDGSSTDIGIPDAPSISAASTGFISLFNPSLSQLNDLASFMWSDLFDIDTFKKLFADPMQTILGLSVIPGPIPSAGASEVKVGNISTGVTMNKAAQQYITIDCGSLNVNEYWGAYLDYDPYTKCEIYLPYIGTHAIAADDIMGKTVQVVYRIDILSGACMAYIKCGGSVLYQFAGQCAASIPITGNDWTNVINGTLSVAASIGSMVATGGATAPLAANALANAAVNQMKPSVEKSGSLSGAAGIMGIQQPYLIVTRPRQALPYKQNTYTGYPSLYSVNLSELTGYTEIEKIHLEGIPATEKELTEIDTLLKGGVIF